MKAWQTRFLPVSPEMPLAEPSVSTSMVFVFILLLIYITGAFEFLYIAVHSRCSGILKLAYFETF